MADERFPQRTDFEPEVTTVTDAATEIHDLRRKLAEPLREDTGDWKERGESYGHLGDLLISSGRIAEAAQAYQQATDAFGKVDPRDPRSEHFAGKVVSTLKELRKHPDDRLDLLLAKLENERRELTARGADQ